MARDKEAEKAKVKEAKEAAAVLRAMPLADRRQQALKAMLSGVNKKYGANSLGFAVSLGYRPVPRISSGIFILDYALGGGWARGRMNTIWGDRSASKTTTVLRAIATAQKTDVHTGRYIWEVRSEHDAVRAGDPVMVERYLRQHDAVVQVEEGDAAWGRARLDRDFDEKNEQHTDRLPKITAGTRALAAQTLKLADVAKEVAALKANPEVTEDQLPKRWKDAQGVALASLKPVIPMVCQFIDIEGSLDFAWARRLGVDTDAMLYSRPDSAEEAAEMVETALGSTAIDVVALDSLAAMTPQAEGEGEMTDNHVGLAARLNSKMFRKIQRAINRVYKDTEGRVLPTLFVINQIRQKIGVMYGSPDIKPGGVAQDFYGSIEVKFGGNKVNYFDKDKQLPRASEFNFVVVKNKCGPPKIHGSYEMMLVDDEKDGGLRGGEIIEVKEVVQFAEQMGIYGKGEGDKGFRMYDDVLDTKRDLYEKYIVDRERFATLKRDVVAKLVPKQ